MIEEAEQLSLHQNRRVHGSGQSGMLGVLGAGELAGNPGEEEVDGVSSGVVEGPGVIEADVGVKGWGGEDDVAPGAGEEGGGWGRGARQARRCKELGRDGVDERSGGEEESATGREGGELDSEGSDLAVEIDNVSWSRTGITLGQQKRGVGAMEDVIPTQHLKWEADWNLRRVAHLSEGRGN